MKKELLETPAVEYSGSATKVLRFNIPSNRCCFRLHWHDSMEFLRVKRGTIGVELGNNTVEAAAGEIIIIPPKALHIGHSSNTEVEYDVLMFDVRSFYNSTEVCKNILPAIFDGRAVFNSVTSNPAAISCMDRICDSGKPDSLEATAEIYKLLGILFENELLKLNTHPINNFPQKVIDYFEENFAEDISVTMLCKRFGYTPAHFCRKFKQSTGLPPMTYLKIYRLEVARDKLRTGKSSISSIATECGFPDANYFTRCFKAHFGVSPTSYIKL